MDAEQKKHRKLPELVIVDVSGDTLEDLETKVRDKLEQLDGSGFTAYPIAGSTSVVCAAPNGKGIYKKSIALHPCGKHN